MMVVKSEVIKKFDKLNVSQISKKKLGNNSSKVSKKKLGLLSQDVNAKKEKHMPQESVKRALSKMSKKTKKIKLKSSQEERKADDTNKIKNYVALPKEERYAPVSGKKFKGNATSDIVLLNSNKGLHTDSPAASKKKKYVFPSKVVTIDNALQSLSVLSKLYQKSKENTKIFEEEAPIFLEIRPIKIQNDKVNVKFLLPHSTIPSTGEVCLVTSDLKKGKKHDHEPSIDHWEELLKNSGITEVKTVLPMRQLRVEYDQYELKRRLMTQHDVILVDSRILNHVSHILGKKFFQKHNMVVPVRLLNRDVKTNIQNGLKTSILRLNIGPTAAMTIGHLGMKMEHVAENLLSVVEQIKQKFPGGEANIRALHIKLARSLSLPIYITLRPKRTVAAPKIHHSVPKKHQVVEDELSTVLTGTVKVTPEGRVVLVEPNKSGKLNKLSEEGADDEDISEEDLESDDAEEIKNNDSE